MPSARLPPSHSVVGCDWDGAKQMLVLCDTPLRDDVGELSLSSAQLSHVCCSAHQGQLHWFIHKMFLFPMNPVEISGLSKWGCNIKWWHVELGLGRAAGCWQFPWLLMATARACRFWAQTLRLLWGRQLAMVFDTAICLCLASDWQEHKLVLLPVMT